MVPVPLPHLYRAVEYGSKSAEDTRSREEQQLNKLQELPEIPVIAVVDDDVAVRSSAANLIRSLGLKAMPFASGEELMCSPSLDQIACVITDVQMPGMTGLELQRELNRRDDNSPIILISGHADVPSGVRAMKAGAIDFLQKPFSDQTLLDIIHGALRRHRAARRDRAEVAAIRQRFDTLSPRERDVFRIVIQGRLNREIADELGLSEKTVKFHRGRVMKKMGKDSVAELVRDADRLAGCPTSERAASEPAASRA